MKVVSTVSNDKTMLGTPTKASLKENTTNTKPPKYKKNKFIQWDDYFMFLALLSAKRSKDPVTQVGACIVDNENRIVAIGYNGLPRKCHDDEFPWLKSDDTINDKKMYVVHAEANAILNKNSASINGMRLYTTLFPCNECTKLIIQSGIGNVFYLSDKYENKPKYQASKRMFNATGVKYNRLQPQRFQIKLDFERENIDTDGTGDRSGDPSLALKNLKLNSTPPLKHHHHHHHHHHHTIDDDKLSSSIPASFGSGKRQDYIEWDDYFMAIALLTAKRSKDPEFQVGACIVDNEQRVVAIGYNGLPRNCNDNEFPWEIETAEDVEEEKEVQQCMIDPLICDKKLYVVHAEANAILNKNSASINGMRLYTTLFPCNECTKLIIQSGIVMIYYLSDELEDKPKYKAAKRMLKAAGIGFQKFHPVCDNIPLNFEEIIREDPSTPIK